MLSDGSGRYGRNRLSWAIDSDVLDRLYDKAYRCALLAYSTTILSAQFPHT